MALVASQAVIQTSGKLDFVHFCRDRIDKLDLGSCAVIVLTRAFEWCASTGTHLAAADQHCRATARGA
jgi:hypothetical protein